MSGKRLGKRSGLDGKGERGSSPPTKRLASLHSPRLRSLQGAGVEAMEAEEEEEALQEEPFGEDLEEPSLTVEDGAGSKKKRALVRLSRSKAKEDAPEESSPRANRKKEKDKRSTATEPELPEAPPALPTNPARQRSTKKTREAQEAQQALERAVQAEEEGNGIEEEVREEEEEEEEDLTLFSLGEVALLCSQNRGKPPKQATPKPPTAEEDEEGEYEIPLRFRGQS